MHIGYARISKADGSQALNLQRDARLTTGIRPSHIYAELEIEYGDPCKIHRHWLQVKT